MTEQEWMESADPERMLANLGERVSERKLRLFACACCRLIPGFMESEPDRLGLEFTEQDVDAELPEDFEFPHDEDWDIRWYRRDGWNAVGRAIESYWTALDISAEQATDSDDKPANLVREVCGNPFKPVTLKPAWLTAAVKVLAEQIYTERLFERMVILADALEDASCNNSDILNHCRSEAPHVRGCWVVDLLLGKE